MQTFTCVMKTPSVKRLVEARDRYCWPAEEGYKMPKGDRHRSQAQCEMQDKVEERQTSPVEERVWQP